MRFWHSHLSVVSAVVCHFATRFRTTNQQTKSLPTKVDNGFFNTCLPKQQYQVK